MSYGVICPLDRHTDGTNLQTEPRIADNSVITPTVIRQGDHQERNVGGMRKVPLASSPGPDGIFPKTARNISNGIMLNIMNLILCCGDLPVLFRVARTIFIPKVHLKMQIETKKCEGR